MLRPRAVALSLALVLGAAGCSGGSGDGEPDQPDPQQAATALASGLAAKDLSKVTFTPDTATAAQASYDRITQEMGSEGLAVDTAGVKQTGSSAVATLHWTWDLSAATWAYDSKVQMTLVDDAWQVAWAPSVVEPTLEEGENLDVSSVLADRGDILGAGGQPIVTEREVSRVGIDKTRLDGADPAQSARAMARLVGVDVAPYVKAVKAAGDQAFVEAIVFRREELSAEVSSGVGAIPGGRVVAGTLPLAPTRDFAAPLLGRVGQVTADIIKEHPEYHPGDTAGLSGLEARYDEQLRGTPGVLVQAVPEKGNPRELFRTEATPGDPLVLSLDVGLQTKAEQLLAGVGPASALVAMRPSTGEILAAANGPGNGGQNLATFGQFAPGSTFKTVSSLALLRAGLTPGTVVPCTPTITVDGKRFKNYSDYPSSALGNIPLRTAVANSCNTAFISQAPKLSGTNLFDAGVSLGIGLDHDLGFPAFFGKTEPDPSSETGAAAQLIGQGTILASPMVMATVISSVQQGSLVVPWLVDGHQDTPPDGAAPLSESEASSLRSMLRAVVTDGSGRGLADVPGPPVIAKTGTAEFGTGDSLQTHAWMIAAQGDLAACVFVDVGDSGSGTAGPILEAFLRAAQAG
ncbi:MAG TPA: penicillin-binding transpeptidase domain-containing protein [Nocardioides sp.]|uniref:penicillin-binding transpeptidase domain-containing protein n=1 Tax=Nocardioides sp. TaxID=35761 RepID=UPI002E356DCB|nr:penicillin-binding transpeptidase domain-containing protein [Nocardioides sp.]HEX5087422.1 penicillin-binding transpeptidase domain-containing protein [Nocardioides sp.]